MGRALLPERRTARHCRDGAFGEQTVAGAMSASTSPTITEVASLLAEPQPDGSVRCGVCAHRCLVRPGRDGICGVRHNRAGTLVCSAYGHVAAVGLDPIEKKPLFHVDPGSRSYSIATAGCPFHCRFCQNWEIAQAPRLGTHVVTRPMSPAEIVAEALALDSRSIAYTYVEPTVFLEYALDTGRLARSAGLRNLFVSDGYATPEAIDLLAGILDAANIDLKSFDDAFYRRLCGARLAPVLDAIMRMQRAGIWIELTTLIIPGRNDSDEELEQLTNWIVEAVGPTTPWHVSRFFPAHQMFDVPSTPTATLLRAAQIGRAAGLHYVYVGNAPQLGLEDTLCPGCGAVLIERSGYRAHSRLTDAGACPRCGRVLEGVGLARRAFADHPGRPRATTMSNRP
jgi:pyruvate formate lyase activating enzyme